MDLGKRSMQALKRRDLSTEDAVVLWVTFVVLWAVDFLAFLKRFVVVNQGFELF